MTRSAELRALADEQDRGRIAMSQDDVRYFYARSILCPCAGTDCKVLVWGKYTHCSRCLRAEAERIDNEGGRDE